MSQGKRKTELEAYKAAERLKIRKAKKKTLRNSVPTKLNDFKK